MKRFLAECFALDTNILLDYVVSDFDVNKHLQAQELVEALKKEKFKDLCSLYGNKRDP